MNVERKFENDIKTYLKEIWREFVNSTQMAQNRICWRIITDTVKTTSMKIQLTS
jgi:hypothetical protein